MLQLPMRDFRKLIVWQKGHELVLSVYRSTATYPKDELFGLTSQTRRSVCSITHNLAEGCGRSTEVELARFMDIASGSASELENQLLIGRDLHFLKNEDYEKLQCQLVEIRRMLNSYIQKLRK